MSDEAGRISGRGLGFFTANGVLKTKEDLRSESSSRASSNGRADGVSATFSDRLSEALGKAQSRFIERANNAITAAQIAQDGIRKARDVTAREIAVAKDLKKAIKNGDTQKAGELRGSLGEIQKEREAIAQQIDEENRRSDGIRRQTLNLGASDRGTVTISPVRFEARSEANAGELLSESSVDEFIQLRQADRRDLRSQAQELSAVKKQIRDAIKGVKEEIAGIRGESIESFERAEKIAGRVASDLRAGGLVVLEETISKSISSEVVQGLLDAA